MQVWVFEENQIKHMFCSDLPDPILKVTTLCIFCRLKKEHEKIRQETVKVILKEQGSLQEEARLVKLEQEEVRHILSTKHTKATKDPDPFHQLYELRKGKLLLDFWNQISETASV